MSTTDSHFAEPDHVRLGRALKVLFRKYSVKSATVQIQPHTTGEELTYQYGPSLLSRDASGQTTTVKDHIDCHRVISEENHIV